MPPASQHQSNTRHAFRLIARIFASVAIAAFAACDRSSSPATSSSGGNSAGAISSTAGSPPKSVNVENPVIQIETSLGPITLHLDGVRARARCATF